jgi:ferredoxin-fold anticodon binding domain-containing protein
MLDIFRERSGISVFLAEAEVHRMICSRLASNDADQIVRFPEGADDKILVNKVKLQKYLADG